MKSPLDSQIQMLEKIHREFKMMLSDDYPAMIELRKVINDLSDTYVPKKYNLILKHKALNGNICPICSKDNNKNDFSDENDITTQIISVVANFYGCTVDNVLSRKRNREYAKARQLCGYFINVELKYASTLTAAYLNKDHATVLWYSKQIKKQLKKEAFINKTKQLFEKLHQIKILNS